MMLRKDWGIQSRVLFVALAPVIATATALALYFTLLRYNDVESALRQRGLAMGRQLAPAAQYGLFSGNTTELNHLIQALSREPDVSAISVYDPSGKLLTSTGKALASPSPTGLVDGWQGQSGNGNTLSFHSKVLASSQPFDDPFSQKATFPDNKRVLGSVTIELSRNNLLAKKREILLFTLGAAALILLVAGYIARRLGRDISEPVIALDYAVRQIRDGWMATRVRNHPAGTLRSLEDGINLMAAALEKAQQRSTEALMSSDTRLRQQSDFASALLEAQSNAGVCLITVEEGRIVFANQAAASFAGRTIEDLLSLSPYDVAAPEERDELNRLAKQAVNQSSEYSRIEVTVLTPEGIVRYAEIAAFMTMRSGTRQIVFLGVDVTQRKKASIELMAAHKLLQLQKEEAERASAAKSRFIAAASHDLRQPLHALSLFSDQLQEKISTPAQSLLSNQISAAIDNMSELLESLLSISKLDLMSLQPEIRAIKVWPLLMQVAEAHLNTAKAKRLRLTVVPTSLWISSNARYLSHILGNLISNATRYTHQGGIVIGARRSGCNVRIEVWDTGIGIEPEHTPFLFQEFYQVANPERDSSKGLGLGLAIVERVANILGCQIGVRSVPGVGSMFSVLIPQADTNVAAQNISTTPNNDLRILLAIADIYQSAELTVLMEKWGYSIVALPPEGVVFPTGERLPDLVLCDVSSGLDIDQISGFQSPSTIPIIIVADKDEPIPDRFDGHDYTILNLPLKPAKLRALILHQVAQKTRV